MIATESPQVVALMLAAGRSRRFGADKRQAQLTSGQRLLTASLAAATEHLPELWLVLRADDDPQALGVAAQRHLLFSTAADQGMGHSLADGIAALVQHSSADAVAVLLGDMPWIASASFGHVLAQASAEHIVVPTCQGEPGHPVVFGRAFWPALLQLGGDRGAKAVWQAHPQALRWVEVGDPGILRDVDTPLALLLP